MNKFVRSAVTTVAMTAGLGLAGLGAAAGAQAQVGPFPEYPCGGLFEPPFGPGCDGYFGDRGDDGYYGDRGDDFRGPGDFRGDDRGPGDFRGDDR